jgi:hypothetical protein
LPAGQLSAAWHIHPLAVNRIPVDNTAENFRLAAWTRLRIPAQVGINLTNKGYPAAIVTPGAG